jgi:putative oxidoreductase
MESSGSMIDLGALLGRFCLSFVFLWSGITKARDRVAGRAEIAALGIPYPGLFLILTVICQIGGGLMVLLGFWARVGAFFLLGFTVVATLLAHASQGFAHQKNQQQLTTTFEHLAIVGGFVLLMAYGPGGLSIDHWLR